MCKDTFGDGDGDDDCYGDDDGDGDGDIFDEAASILHDIEHVDRVQ
jgi:hypothetical protein